jgi:hypothetical protein
MASIQERIIKDIAIFDKNILSLSAHDLSPGQKEIVELAAMYAKDSKSFLDKGDFYTSFSAIAYAHGLLDSIIKLNQKM